MSVRMCEPSLNEVLQDPLVHLLMASDGVTDATVRDLVHAVRREQPTRDEEVVIGEGAGPIEPAAELWPAHCLQ